MHIVHNILYINDMAGIHWSKIMCMLLILSLEINKLKKCQSYIAQEFQIYHMQPHHTLTYSRSRRLITILVRDSRMSGGHF